MELKQGIDTYAVPPHSKITEILLQPEGEDRAYRLVPFSPVQMKQAKKRARDEDDGSGRTAYFAVNGLSIVLHPTPEFAGELRVRYAPPEEEA